MLDYISLRNFDIRVLQEKLAKLGLSSLGRAEGHVQASLLAVRNMLLGGKEHGYNSMEPILSFDESREILRRNTDNFLGPPPSDRRTRIMVSLPTEAGNEYDLVKKLIESGMECARINCAHDDEVVWENMIENIKTASSETGRPCKILMDLAGPKIRTGRIKSGAKVIKISPEKDELGNVLRPAKYF